MLGLAAKERELFTPAERLLCLALADPVSCGRAAAHLAHLDYYRGNFGNGVRRAEAVVANSPIARAESQLYRSVNLIALNDGRGALEAGVAARNLSATVQPLDVRHDLRFRVARQLVHVYVAVGRYIEAAREAEVAAGIARQTRGDRQVAVASYLLGYVRAARGDRMSRSRAERPGLARPLLWLVAAALMACAGPAAAPADSPPVAATASTPTATASVSPTPRPEVTLPPIAAVNVPTGWGNPSVQDNVAAWNGASTLTPASGPVIIDTVFVHDLKTGQQRRVARTTFPGGQIGQVRTDGRWVVWTDLEFFRIVAGEWRIYALDLITGAQTEVGRNTTPGEVLARHDFTWPTIALEGRRVVWDEGYVAEGRRAIRIRLAELGTKKTVVLVDSSSDGLLQPTISRGRAAFVRVPAALLRTASRPSIRVLDLATGREWEPDPGAVGFQPWLWGDLLVWKGGALGQAGDVVLHDLQRGTTRVLAREVADLPSVGERYVTWQDRSFQRVPVFDLVHGVELTAATGSAGRPVVQGDVVAWISVDAPEPNWRGSIRYMRGR